MSDLSKIYESLSLIDVFRLTVRKDELSSIEASIQAVLKEAIPSSSDKPTGTNKVYKVQCLDLGTLLADKRVVEENDDKPWDKLEQILFERLMLEDYTNSTQAVLDIPVDTSGKLVLYPNFYPGSQGNEFNPSDSQILRYLYGCYYRLQQISRSLRSNQNIKELVDKTLTTLDNAETFIMNQVVLYLTEPDLFPDRDKRSKNNQQAPLLLNLVSLYYSRQDESHIETVQKFVNSLADSCTTVGDAGYEAIMGPTYARLSQKFVKLKLDDPSVNESIEVVKVFLQHPELARKFLERNTPKLDNSLTYQSTLLGFMICVSHLPRPSQNEIIFFNNAQLMESDHKFTENQLGIKLKQLGQDLHKLFHSLLKIGETRNMFLSWIGRCLYTFKDRQKIWSNQVLMDTTTISINDGFLMNFLTVMLHLSEPFAGPYDLETIMESGQLPKSVDKKMLKIDPRYCKWSSTNHENSAVHFLGLSKETFLIHSDNSKASTDSNTTVIEEVKPNFISECFYGTHQALTYGFRCVYDRFFKLAQRINELQHSYADTAAHHLSSGQDVREMIKERINSSMTLFFNLKAVLMVPSRISMQMHFCIATAAYLNHLVACKNHEEVSDSKDLKTITMKDLQEKRLSRTNLEFIPEMLVENILDFFLFLKHFNEQALVQASNKLEPIMTLIITFMGDSSLMQNPHLRARFAEILECLMPHQSHYGNAMVGCEMLFENHPLIDGLAPSLINVFVSIEMTGEGVQFEQKFSYRRPMYVVLEYLWGRPLHRRILIRLAEEAEHDIDCARPPLFLRFINLLMNDAIFLLDEALGYMNQLREAESRRKTEEWRNLRPDLRERANLDYTHVGRLARFHNVLSLSTIGTLAWLTGDIKTIFCHPTLVDRIANMLNYFLEHLVGSKRGKFKVNDENDYEFKPKEVLEKICQIYINLGSNNKKFKEFCSAVSSDGRSYSDNLLPQARDILFRTGYSSLGTEFEKLSQLVHKIAVDNQMDEIQIEDVPDSFLDPIMSTLMVDPVLLPSSKIIVDRSTISRHLLSDQTDPFNRSPLSMEEIIPETNLKNQIETFLKEKREANKLKRTKDSESNR